MKKILVILGLIASAIAFTGFQPADSESNSVITDWMKLQQSLIRNTSGMAHVAHSRPFAYTAVAVYEAIAAGDKYLVTLSGQLQGLKISTASPEKMSRAAAANSAYSAMFRHFYGKPGKNVKLIDSLENVIIQKLTDASGSKAVSAGAEFGKKIAAEVIAWSLGDGSENKEVYNIPGGEGMWTKTPPAFGNPAMPFWSKNRTLVTNPTAVILKAPLNKFSFAHGSSFFEGANEVYEISKKLTDEEKSIGWFWDDSPNGKYLTVFGHWNSIYLQLLQTRKFTLNETAVGLVKLALSQHDASVVCWTGKYQYNVMRPISYINKYIDANWTPLIETPPHPEYPAAHAMLSAAAGAALENVVGKSVTFTDAGYQTIGLGTRSFTSIAEAAKEAGMSRVYGGIHYRASVDAGYDMGVLCAEHVLKSIKFYKNNQ